MQPCYHAARTMRRVQPVTQNLVSHRPGSPVALQTHPVQSPTTIASTCTATTAMYQGRAAAPPAQMARQCCHTFQRHLQIAACTVKSPSARAWPPLVLSQATVADTSCTSCKSGTAGAQFGCSQLVYEMLAICPQATAKVCQHAQPAAALAPSLLRCGAVSLSAHVAAPPQTLQQASCAK